MAQFKFINELTSLTKMDGPINKGPVPRWQIKAQESQNSSKLKGTSFNSTAGTNISISKSPKKSGSSGDAKGKMKTPSKNKSPSK